MWKRAQFKDSICLKLVPEILVRVPSSQVALSIWPRNNIACIQDELFIFPNSTYKIKTGAAKGQRLLIANHLDQ
jgi:hypothetical protein